METATPPTDAELVAAYEAGAGIRTIAKRAGLSYNKAREHLVALGVEIRPSTSRGARQPDSAERLERVLEVARLMVDGTTGTSDLARALATDHPEWDVSEHTLKDYKTDAYALLRERTEQEVEDLRALRKARYEQLWQEAESTRDRLDVLKDENKFDGLYPAEKHEHSGSISWMELVESATAPRPDA